MAAAASVIFVLGSRFGRFLVFLSERGDKGSLYASGCFGAGRQSGRRCGTGIFSIYPSGDPDGTEFRYKQPADGIPAGMTAQSETESESVSVRLSITIRQRVQQTGDGYFSNSAVAQTGSSYQNTTGRVSSASDTFSAVPAEEEQATTPLKYRKSRKWALKAALGTSLLKGDYNMPLTAAVTVERSLNSRFALETGILYNRLHADRTLHTLGIPVKLNMTLASTPKLDLYATVGGTAEKCIAGAADNGFNAEPVQLSVAAGVGVRYRLNDRFALFAEPSVSHHFGTDSETGTLRTERPTNLNLLCGVRMTY